MRIQGNRFFAAAGFKNRNGIGGACGTSIQIKDNYFYGMAREGMPGAIDLEPNTKDQFIGDIEISGNEMIGTAPCWDQTGIGVGNHAGANLRNILVENNRVQGCFKYGILVNGVGRLEEDGSDPANPVVIAGNTIEIMIEGSNLSDSPAAGIVVRRNNLPGDNPPEKRIGSALITGNVIRGPANPGTAGTAGTIVEGRGIWIDHAEATIVGNTIEDAKTWGIEFQDTLDKTQAIISGNRIVNCGNNGAPAAPEYCTTYCTTTPELCPSDIFGGIKLRCSDCLVTGNQIISSKSPLTPTGIYIWGGNRNLVADNFMKGVGHFGIDAVSQIFDSTTSTSRPPRRRRTVRIIRGSTRVVGTNYKPRRAPDRTAGKHHVRSQSPFRRAGGMGLRGPGTATPAPGKSSVRLGPRRSTPRSCTRSGPRRSRARI